jgi:hypothetical protein
MFHVEHKKLSPLVIDNQKLGVANRKPQGWAINASNQPYLVGLKSKKRNLLCSLACLSRFVYVPRGTHRESLLGL